MYFLIRDKTLVPGTQIRVYENETKTYFDLKQEGFDLYGQFSNSIYANFWADYHNGKISQEELRRLLELNP